MVRTERAPSPVTIVTPPPGDIPPPPPGVTLPNQPETPPLPQAPKQVVPSTTQPALSAPGTKPAADDIHNKDTEFERLQGIVKHKGPVTVAILEGGVDFSHEALQGHTWTNKKEIAGNGKDDDKNGYKDDVHGYDFTKDKGEITPNHPHPTHVAGIASRGTDAIKIMSTRAGDLAKASKWGEAIDYAAANGAKVLNFSYLTTDKDEIKAIRDAIKRHPEMTFVLAAGNDGAKLGEGTHKEADYSSSFTAPNVIIVASVDGNGALASNSNRGKDYVNLAARGVDVTSAVPGGDEKQYQTWSGTSMAAPQVTNLVAKVEILAPKLKPAEIKRLLSETSDKDLALKDDVAAGGKINAERAMKVAALIQLDGHMTLGQAAGKLGLKDPERQELMRIARHFVGANE
jgi:subtilisin family serine protease